MADWIARLCGTDACALLLLAATLTTAFQLARAESPKTAQGKLAASNEKWVRNTLRKMTLEQKLGQMIVVGYFGEFMNVESSPYRRLTDLVERGQVGGVIVTARRGPLGVERSQAYPTAALANQLQRRARVALLIAGDFERGTSQRILEGTSFPHAMALAAGGDPQAAYEMGRTTAFEARALGVHWVFAPVADVNVNPDNPIINVRAFAENPVPVAQFVAAFVRGAQEAGTLATAKHFPGHGDVTVDSHLDLAVVDRDRQRLEAVELVPFRAAIEAGVGSIMTGHLAVPALDPDRRTPATLSRPVLTDLLRREMHYDGLIATDAMDMAGVANQWPPGEAAVRAVLAGADVLLLVEPESVLPALAEAVQSGRIPPERVDASVTRILRAKARLGLNKNRLVDLEKLNTVFGRPEYRLAAERMAERGVTLVRDEPHLVPLDSTKPLRLLLLAVSADPDPYPAEILERELRSRTDQLQVLRCDTRFVNARSLRLPEASDYDVALIALFVRVMDRKGSLGLPPEQSELVTRLLAAGKPTVVALLGNPYLAQAFSSAPTVLLTFSHVDVAERALARALFGQSAIAGKLPVSIPGVASAGHGWERAGSAMRLSPAPAETEARLQPVYRLLGGAVAERVTPGGILAVGWKGSVAVHPFGKLTYDANAAAVTPDTIYDIASLTKVVGATTLVMQFVESGKLQLDAPLSRYLPEWLLPRLREEASVRGVPAGEDRAWREQVTLRRLLTHSSGLPAYKEFFLDAKNRAEIVKRTLATPLAYQPGTKSVYSDLGVILLGEVLARVSGRSLGDLFREQIFLPLGMSTTMFNPPKSLLKRIAPTELDQKLRKRTVHGQAHDENAYVMGGESAHAGLFATAGDLAAFCQMMLNGGIYGHQRLLRRSTMEEFTRRQGPGDSTRALGWDTASPESSSGHFLSSRTYGHTGFTGTSIWIDPAKELFVVLLTNRVHPTRENEAIRQLRPRVADAVVEALGLKP